MTDNACIAVTLKTDYLNYRPTGVRRIDVHGAIGICVKVTAEARASSVGAVSGKGAEALTCSKDLTEPVCCIEKSILIDEELPLSDGDAPIDTVVRCEAHADITDSKLISGKLVAKGILGIHVLYEPEGSKRYRVLRTEIPFSEMADASDADDGDDTDIYVTVAAINVKPHKDLSGINSAFSIEAKLILTADITRKVEKSFVTDAYSTAYEYLSEYKDIGFIKDIATVKESFACTKSLDVADGSLSAVVDMWSDVRVGNVKRCEKGLVLDGTVTLCILGFDAESTAVYAERPVDFEYALPLKEIPESYFSASRITVTDIEYTVGENGKLDARLTLSVCCRIETRESIRVLSDFKVCTDKKRTPVGDFALAVYYGCCGESIWAIAKRYNTSASSIRCANGLECDELSENKMLLIPCI